MINFSIDSKLYKYSNYTYNLLKLNFLIMICSLTIVGFGSSIATGFYMLNQLIKKDVNIKFSIFFKNFKENFQKGLIFTAPIIFFLYTIFKNFGWHILNNIYYKYSFGIFAILFISFMFTLLITVGLINMSIKNILIYSAYIYIKNLIILLLSTVFLGIIFKNLLFRSPILLMLFSFVILIGNYYMIFRKNIENEIYLQGEKCD